MFGMIWSTGDRGMLLLRSSGLGQVWVTWWAYYWVDVAREQGHLPIDLVMSSTDGLGCR